MIKFGALIVCLIVTGIFYFLDRKRYLWWEFFIPVVITVGMIFGISALIQHGNVQFTEYWGETIISVYEEEPYNYWQHQTCTRSYPCGTDSEGNTKYCTETYDCSHQVDVGPSWSCKTDLGNSYNITENKYDSIKILWGTPRAVVNSHHNYAPRDRCVGSNGTKFEGKRVGETSYVWQTDWPGTDPTRKGYFTMHQYENRIKASDLSLFNISVVTDEEADSLGLYKYPEINGGGWFGIGDNIDFPTILGPNVSKQTQENFRKLNAKFGPTNKLRLWILIFDNKPATLAAYQENYWVKGNKNELVLCIGTKGQEITWTHAFSWALSGDLTAEVAQKALDLYTLTVKTKSGKNIPVGIPLIGLKTPVDSVLRKTIQKETGIKIDSIFKSPILPLQHEQLSKLIGGKEEIVDLIKSATPILNDYTWEEYYSYLNSNLQRFQKRSFEEFSYVKVELKNWQVILIYVLALLISVGINFWTFLNEFTDDNPKGNDHSYYGSYRSKFRRY